MRMLIIGNAPRFHTFSVGDTIRIETGNNGHVLMATAADGNPIKFIDVHGDVVSHYRLGQNVFPWAIAELIASIAGLVAEPKERDPNGDWQEYALCMESLS